MNGFWEKTVAFLRREPRCSWVQDRIPAFSMCDPSLTQEEWDSISRHVERCEACARALDEVEDTLAAVAGHLYPESELPPFDAEAVAQEILAGNRNSRFHLDQDVEHRIVLFPGAKRSQAAGPKRRFRLASAAALAAAVLVMVSVPVLAYVGVQVLQQFAANNEMVPLSSNIPAKVTRISPPTAQSSPSDTAAKTPRPKPAEGSPLTTGIDDQLTRLTDEAAARAEVEAMLPHTEAEYEAWARQEYPHIMWLYDVLRSEAPPGKQGLNQADRGTSGEGKQGLTQAQRDTSEDGSVPALAKNVADAHFPMAKRIVDFYHAKEHVASLCAKLFAKPESVTRYRERWWDCLAEGRIEAIVDEAASLLPPNPQDNNDARREVEYLRKNKEQMRYAAFREQGYFIGSGVIEAGCKHVVGKRLKQSGMKWTVRGANAIIATKSNRFNDYWEQRTA